MRARPQRVVIERGELRAEVDAAVVVALLDETRPPVADDKPVGSAYDVVHDYGDHEERLRFEEDELPGEVREALDARLEPGA